MAVQMMNQDITSDSSSSSALVTPALKPILLVCGPSGTGKTSLVRRLIDDGEGKFVRPQMVDKIAEGPRFEMMESRGQILKMIDSRYGVSADGILNVADSSKGQVVVVDADVELAEKLSKLSGARIIGVWVGLDSLDKLKDRFKTQIASKQIRVPPGETEESVIRGKIRKVIKDIEFGVVSGMFDFTILNDDFEQSVVELKEAAEYCFK